MLGRPLEGARPPNPKSGSSTNGRLKRKRTSSGRNLSEILRLADTANVELIFKESFDAQSYEERPKIQQEGRPNGRGVKSKARGGGLEIVHIGMYPTRIKRHGLASNPRNDTIVKQILGCQVKIPNRTSENQDTDIKMDLRQHFLC